MGRLKKTIAFLKTKKPLDRIKWFFATYKHAWLFLYGIVYITWFKALEVRTNVQMFNVHTSLDDRIPFNEFFIIPYMMWFFYIGWVLVYFCLVNKTEFFKVFIAMFGGMTICLVIYTIWPNMQSLRPTTFARDNIFTHIVAWLYSIDTPTNVCPSIHVYNSMIAYIAVRNSEEFKRNNKVKLICLTLTVLISLSTMFLKQHSTFDVAAGIILSMLMYLMVYVPDYSGLMANDGALGEREEEI